MTEAERWYKWWQQSFCCRFEHGPINPGTQLYGMRLRIQVHDREADKWITLDERARPVND